MATRKTYRPRPVTQIQYQAVVDGIQLDEILFVGTHDECLHYMRTHRRGWKDLRNVEPFGQGFFELGTLSSYVL